MRTFFLNQRIFLSKTPQPVPARNPKSVRKTRLQSSSGFLVFLQQYLDCLFEAYVFVSTCFGRAAEAESAPEETSKIGALTSLFRGFRIPNEHNLMLILKSEHELRI